MGDLYKMFKSGKLLKQGSGGGGGGGTSDYENLENLPSMNGHVIKGAMVSSDLDLPSIEDVESKADAIETEQALQDKADKSTTYTKTEINTALSNKADKSTTYTKTEVDTALGAKANSADVYSKTAVDTLLGNKADKSTTYTKTEVDTALGDKANEDNVYKLALSNADLLPANTDLDDVKTVGCYYVYESVNIATITHRPTGNASAFRVTVELAAGKSRPRQIYQEFNSYDKYIRYETSSGTWANWKKVEGDLSTKQDTISDLSTIRSGAALGATAVQPETGKGLSTNDYTDAEKTKLAGIAEGAEVNVQSDWNQTTDSADDYIKNKPLFNTAYNALTNKAATMADIKDGILTGYAQTSGNVAATDKVIEAIGKVEKKADDNQNNILYTYGGTVGKNLLRNDVKTETLGGVTGTTNADGSITLSSTGTINNTFVLCTLSTIPVNNITGFSKGVTYKLKASGSEYVDVQVGGVDTIDGAITLLAATGASDVTFTLTQDYVRFRILIKSGADFTTPLTIYPMATLATNDTTYQPYAYDMISMSNIIRQLLANQ